MKKFAEKHSLVKVAGLMVLLSVILTWLVPQGMYQSGSINVTEITRVGLFDFFTYGLLGMYYFTVLVTFVFVLGAFYEVLSRTKGYQALTTGIAKIFKGKEILLVLCLSFIIAAITAITNEYIVMLSVVPFFITIMNKMKLDKMTGFATTFGAILVGILGSVYSTKIVGMNVQILGTTYSALLWVKLVTFAAAYILFNTFTILNILKQRNSKNADVIEDLFESETTNENSRSKAWSVAVVLGLLAAVTLLAYLPWNEVFTTLLPTKIVIVLGIIILLAIVAYVIFKKGAVKNIVVKVVLSLVLLGIVALLSITFFSSNLTVDWTTKALEAINTKEIFGEPIFKYILGNVNEFGKWDIFGVQVMMLISILVIKIIDKMSFGEICEAFGTGFKKIGKLVVIMLLCYLVLEFTVMFPVIPTIVDWFLGLFRNASNKLLVILASIPGMFTSMFSVEYQYTLSLIGPYLTGTYTGFTDAIGYMLQSTYGLASMFSPASAILLMGLSYLGITYKEWMKYIWKFLLAMFAVIIILMIIIA